LVFIVLLLRGTSQVDCGKLFCRLPEAISSSLFSGWLAIYIFIYLFIYLLIYLYSQKGILKI